MSLKKLCCMFAVGVFMMLFSVTAASACTHDHSSLGSDEHVGDTNHRVKSSNISANPVGEQSQAAIKHDSNKRPKSTVRANADLITFQDDDMEFAGSCIHGNGCTCSGRKSHTSGCGTNGDCHAHSGLTCTWG